MESVILAPLKISAKYHAYYSRKVRHVLEVVDIF
jgi:hypothetical protein